MSKRVQILLINVKVLKPSLPIFFRAKIFYFVQLLKLMKVEAIYFIVSILVLKSLKNTETLCVLNGKLIV